jgi:death on curing protein
MQKIKFLTLNQIILIHDKLVNLYGGAQGLRDINLLKSAIAQPKVTFDGKFLHQNINEMAAAYAYHIIKNHAFLDGNKRTGIFSAIVFLEKNRFAVKLSQKQFYQIAVGVAVSKISKIDLAKIFKKYIDKEI